MRVGVIGGRGYVGGELLRLLLLHPYVEISCVTSRKAAGEFVYREHPNLRKLTSLKFEDVNLSRIGDKCDVVFTAVPHGAAMDLVHELYEMGLKVIDLSADFRLKNPEAYKIWYGFEHKYPDLLEKSVYGLPELHRDEIKRAKIVANPGCMACPSILALFPLVKELDVDLFRIVVDCKEGSSAGGVEVSRSSHHPERSNVVRPYKVTGHRHTAEIEQELSAVMGKDVKISMSAHAVDMVRGVLATCHVFLRENSTIEDERVLWRIYRKYFSNEPFIRLVKEKKGIYRLPDPKAVVGTNFCDIGFEYEDRTRRIVALAAVDNLVKGAAGQAIQNMNIMCGIDETTGLMLPGLHPI
ncbi:MAG: N-acetyl-gamma-glutamyl-phosphate reductase [Candidatus Baldrarchaeia archaeon]